jgi:hypothetical protein
MLPFQASQAKVFDSGTFSRVVTLMCSTEVIRPFTLRPLIRFAPESKGARGLRLPDDLTRQAPRLQVPLRDVAWRTRLVAGAGRAVGKEFLREAPEGLRLVRDRAQFRAGRPRQQPCRGDGILMLVRGNVCNMLSHDRVLRVQL